MTVCFVAFGGNLGPVKATFDRCCDSLKSCSAISHFELSPLYITSPVSTIEQPPYLNAVCRFTCTLSLYELFSLLKNIEERMGKRPKPKTHPRPIDLDLLFYGEEVHCSKELVVPHPRWHERLFVIKPLSDLVDILALPQKIDVKSLVKNFPNKNNEIVERYE
ncbi:MAG: 2-amino-4-hydroxy-6-hydroxymethyldihydropteridine diphosphokinase [Chlamydiales bacterium]